MTAKLIMKENGKNAVVTAYGPDGCERTVGNFKYAAAECMKVQGLSSNDMALIVEVLPSKIQRFIETDLMSGTLAKRLCKHLNLDENDYHPGYFEAEDEPEPEPHRRNDRWYSCSYQEWAYSQAFSDLRMMTEAPKYIRNRAQHWVIVAILPFALLLASLFIHNFFGYGIYGVISYVIYRFFYAAKLNAVETSKIIRRMEDNFISYVKIEDNGIKVNEKNDENPDSLTLIPWDHIGQIDFCYTRSRWEYNVISKRLTKHADWIPDLVVDYRWPLETYLSLYFYREPDSSPSKSLLQFQIPPSWLMNGEFARLASAIHQKSGVEIKPFDYSRWNAGIFRNGGNFVEKQVKLNRIFKESLNGKQFPRKGA
ncbi:hypothetical protein [Paenibacillus taichungensis]